MAFLYVTKDNVTSVKLKGRDDIVRVAAGSFGVGNFDDDDAENTGDVWFQFIEDDTADLISGPLTSIVWMES